MRHKVKAKLFRLFAKEHAGLQNLSPCYRDQLSLAISLTLWWDPVSPSNLCHSSVQEKEQRWRFLSQGEAQRKTSCCKVSLVQVPAGVHAVHYSWGKVPAVAIEATMGWNNQQTFFLSSKDFFFFFFLIKQSKLGVSGVPAILCSFPLFLEK